MYPSKLKNYISDTGSTWYKPNKYEEKRFYTAYKRGYLVLEDGFYTLPEIKNEERLIAIYAAVKMHSSSTQYPADLINLFIKLFESEENLKLDAVQREAVHLAINSPIFILTGGPGTGKTFTLKCIYFCIRHILQTDDVLFTAPTGNAARRITASVGVAAYTVAKALGLKNEDDTPNKLTNNVVIVDETSMLDTKTCKALFESTEQSRLIFVGDVDQLPSVNYGSILRDLIDAGLPNIKLEKTFRQASESGLFANIEQIKQGLHMGFIERDDFSVIKVPGTEAAKESMVNEYLSAVKAYGLDQVICLTPFRKKGDACAIQLNRILQDKVNPKSKGQNFVKYRVHEIEDDFEYDVELREGDPVLQLVNEDKVANGDVGVIRKIDVTAQTITVDFTDVTIKYYKEQLGQLTLAYAMTIHKSQGSEYACVITSAIETDRQMLSRNTIYTAVTRGKQKCVMVTQGNEAQRACRRELNYERITRLSQEINKQQIRLNLISKLCI